MFSEDDADFRRLVEWIRDGEVAVLAGAGCSTDSGIPDYRGDGAEVRPRARLMYQDFIRKAATRQRYWARSFIGWPKMRDSKPNVTHQALATLESAGLLSGLVTQNVDSLHQRAGSRRVVELHGALGRVMCLDCGARSPRARLQERLAAANPHWEASALAYTPDGDADLATDREQSFQIVDCEVCGGRLKPDVILFGENVPPPTVEAAWDIVNRARRLLVVGSSLTVYSGYRFVVGAAKRDAPIAIVNRGPTRGDEQATLRIDAGLAEVFEPLLGAVFGPDGGLSKADVETP